MHGEEMNILITGPRGFVGSHLSKFLKNKDDNNVVGIVRDEIPSEWLKNALEGVTIVEGDIRDEKLMKRVIGHYDIDQVYHIAAFAQVKQAYKNPVDVFESNVMGTVNILEACRQINKDDIKILVLNTDKVYGERLNAVETDPYTESEPYATSKSCQGLIAKCWLKTYGMDIKMTHSVNIFGYDPFNSRLISNVVKSCIKKEKPVIYTNDNSIREYVYIDDVIQALERIMNRENKHNIYNIHTGWVYNQKDVILLISKYFNTDCEYKEGNVPMQIQEETLNSVNWDWKPSISFEEAITRTIEKFIEYKYDWEYNK
jgi:nucleoside-diphosphate-sugar epimerase